MVTNGLSSDVAKRLAEELAWMEQGTAWLQSAIDSLSDDNFAEPSLLPVWTRAHLVTHLARNADALVNLLTWARTGVEHPMYASRADRDTDIEEGAPRSLWLIEQDVVAACGRFAAAATGLGDTA